MSGHDRPAPPADALERALAALPPPPPPPALARVRARCEEPARLPWARPLAWLTPLRLFLAASAAAAVFTGILVYDAVSRTDEAREAAGESAWRSARAQGALRERLASRGGVRWVSGRAEYVPEDDAAIPIVRASEPVVLALDEGAELRLDAGAEVHFETDPAYPRAYVELGRVRFHAPHGAARPLVVSADNMRIEDLGTTFTVDVFVRGTVANGYARGPVLVTVEEGRVRAAGALVSAGQGLLLEAGRPEGEPWALGARPALALEVEGADARAGRPVVVRVVLENPTGAWIPLSEPDLVRAPLWIEVTDPSGAATPVRVTSAMLEPGDAPRTAIPPRGKAVVRVRFERTFASPGTYRLRAIYRAADEVERPTSPSVQFVVR